MTKKRWIVATLVAALTIYLWVESYANYAVIFIISGILVMAATLVRSFFRDDSGITKWIDVISQAFALSGVVILIITMVGTFLGIPL